MRTQTFESYFLHTAVKLFKVPKDVLETNSDDITFNEDGCLVINGDTFTPARETLIKRGNPYAVKWDMAWFEIDPNDSDEELPTSMEEDQATGLQKIEKNYEECGHSKVSYIITHHHVSVTKQADVTNDTEAGRTAQSIIDDYPNIEEIEFSFKDGQVEIEFENHGGRLTCPLKEISRSNKTEPYAVYLGHGALIKEDECWTMCQQQIKKLKKKS